MCSLRSILIAIVGLSASALCLAMLTWPCQAPGQTAADPSSSKPPPKQPVDAAQIERLIRQLGSESFEEREAASKALEAIGKPAMPALRKAQENADPEIRRRVAALLKALAPRLQLQNTLEGQDWFASTLAFSPDSKVLASGGDGTIRLWDVASGKTIHVLRNAGRAPAFSSDGKMLASCGDRRIMLWDVVSGKQISTIFAGYPVHSVVFSPDGKTLSAIEKDWVVVWDREKKDEVRSWKMFSMPVLVTGDSSIKRPLLATYRKRERLGNPLPFSLIDAFTGEPILECTGHISYVSYVALSRDETMVASTGDRGGIDVRLWERATAKHVATFECPPVRVRCLALSPDAGIVALGHARGSPSFPVASGFRLYEVPSGKLLAIQEVSEIAYLVFSPDGRILASSAGRSVKLWTVPAAWRKRGK